MTAHRPKILRITRFACCLSAWLTAAYAQAAPSQNDVFKSIQDSVGDQSQVSMTPVVLLLLGGGLVALVLVLLSRRQNRVVTPVTLNSPSRLARELVKAASLKPAEMKQLKMLADSVEKELGETPGPLTLLLCPSLLARAVKAEPAKMDRKAVAQVVRKLKLSRIHEPRE